MKKLTLTLFILVSLPLFAQYTPQREWQYIDTEYNRIIFPAEMTQEGLRVAYITSQIYPIIEQTMKPENPQIYPIILSDKDMYSNGFVAPFPKRSVWYNLPSDNSGTIEWYQHLALHEGRHILQFDTLDRSTTHLLYLLGGEFYSSLAIGITPSWLFEGDAVRSETIYSQSGRGRLGSFMAGMKAISLDDRDFSYYKMLHRSYKDYIPSQYPFGYFMLEHIEQTYGEASTQEIFRQVGSLPLPLWGYSRAIKKVTELPPRAVYKEAMTELALGTQKEIENKGELTLGDIFIGQGKSYTFYPSLFVGQSSPQEPELYYLKLDLTQTTALYRTKGQETEKLFSLSPATKISGVEDTFVWDSVSSDLRYTTLQESDIFLYSPQEGITRVTRGGRYYNPALSTDRKKIAALEFSEQRRPSLIIMDTTGQELDRVELPPQISFATNPTWKEDSDTLLLLVQGTQGEAVWTYTAEEGFFPITPFTPEDLDDIQSDKGGFFFTINRQEGKEVYYYTEGLIKQVTQLPYGVESFAYDPMGHTIYFSAQDDSKGEVIRTLSLTPEIGFKETTLAQPQPALFEEHTKNLTETYTIEKYNPHKLFSPIGWGVLSYQSGALGDNEIPLTLVSINEMQTLSWEAGAYYNINEEMFNYRLTSQFDGLYPMITTQIGWEHRNRNGQILRDFSALAGLTLPFGKTRGLNTWSTTLSGYGVYQNSWNIKSDITQGAQRVSLYEGIELYHSQTGGYRSLQSRWEEYLSVGFLHSFEDTPLYQFSTEAHLLTPGLHPTHGLGLYGYYELNESLQTSDIPAPRGYDYVAEEEIFMASAEYVMPLFYPDVALGGLMYVPRVRTEIFYDSQFSVKENMEQKSSVGCELIVDANLLSLPVLFSGGLRVSWLIEEQETAVEIFLKAISY